MTAGCVHAQYSFLFAGMHAAAVLVVASVCVAEKRCTRAVYYKIQEPSAKSTSSRCDPRRCASSKQTKE